MKLKRNKHFLVLSCRNSRTQIAALPEKTLLIALECQKYDDYFLKSICIDLEVIKSMLEPFLVVMQNPHMQLFWK